MPTYKRLQELEQRLTKDRHLDLFLQTKHLLDSLQAYEEEHRKLVHIQATDGGVRPNREVEVVFYTTIRDFKDQLLDNLEQTANDLEHRWEKGYNKNFADGVE
ncbi:benzoyl-CoA reductase/2-hydroxyglutaryl-CoA dehydratase subunit BcrC/BadD/HgdB [Paenibacillus shirakamiensis]|uniref:Benzoyl-CoA reductase/2-hydroxyglutaryl-CoA dehydratase subunit BcrC/BadD/HgdB n=1 Tax=Paenibacillus shirakamiensis TaxID=1265935 RepID=A0ABS4JF24_9BACL|nr:hypothetical protein [Paenibacillus shirakamiensis]MBP2000302.1 benzoyl-CoA reductase/2-hydroxyglutaryl-CoA dehydratase subunit BcrC/BadD/HgdB [Paenibacillus shirakamiensis]